MTTTVTVTTHDWPAEVRTFPLVEREPVEGGAYSDPVRVEPQSTRQFVVTDRQDVLVRELAKDA